MSKHIWQRFWSSRNFVNPIFSTMLVTASLHEFRMFITFHDKPDFLMRFSMWTFLRKWDGVYSKCLGGHKKYKKDYFARKLTKILWDYQGLFSMQKNGNPVIYFEVHLFNGCIVVLCKKVKENDDEQLNRVLPVIQKRLSHATQALTECLNLKDTVQVW